jgi:nicotinate-nucleotide adenylyltransferase
VANFSKATKAPKHEKSQKIFFEMKTGLLFGSFNPIHIGHLAIANYVTEFTDVKQVWFVVSPQNPLKKKNTLLADHHRLKMVELAVGSDSRFSACDMEFRLPMPSYTIDTLIYLREKYPKKEFSIIMGADNLLTFEKWKNFEQIIRTTKRYIYNRPGVDKNKAPHKENSVWLDAPMMEISSTLIRSALKDGKDIRHFLPPGVYDYIDKMNFYKK